MELFQWAMTETRPKARYDGRLDQIDTDRRWPGPSPYWTQRDFMFGKGFNRTAFRHMP